MFGKKKKIDVEKYEELVNELTKQVELNNQKILEKVDECLELIREAKECVK